jgi:hypothetical protein
VAPCGSFTNRCFEGTSCLHLQRRKIRERRKTLAYANRLRSGKRTPVQKEYQGTEGIVRRLKLSDVSEEYVASIFIAEKCIKKETNFKQEIKVFLEEGSLLGC